MNALTTLTSKWVVGAVAMIGIAGCGAAASPASTATPTVAATTAPAATPAPTPNLTATAAAAYLAAAFAADAGDAAINTRTCGCATYPKTFTSIAQAKDYWSQFEAVEHTFLTTIFAIAYPAFMKTDVDAQIAAETKVVADEAELASDPTDTAAHAALNTDSTTEAGTANIVRHDLGLPQVPLT